MRDEARDDRTTPARPAGGAAGPVAPARERTVAHKEYYSISEVCDIVDLKPHVLRYWETQFGPLNPSKNRSGNRVYQRKEIKLVLLVKHLLYEEKYTVEGARAKLEQLRRTGRLPELTGRALSAETASMVQTELQQLLRVLTPPAT
jgi:DNA-binding transcriptional MerR regulator